ncbi:MAG: hypothetical protein ACPGJV_05890 [Bacteriovoracaceae bacterium]
MDFVYGHGGITTHYTNIDKNVFYCNEFKDTGTIYNKSQFLGFKSGRFSVTAMRGEDSICSKIKEGFITYYPYRGSWWEAGFVFGLIILPLSISQIILWP